MIVLNEINVSRNPNEAAMLMKANLIRAMWGELKRENYRGVVVEMKDEYKKKLCFVTEFHIHLWA